MIEIHLTDLPIDPSVSTAPDGTVRLIMSWDTGIDQALEATSIQLPHSVGDILRSLFASPDIHREFQINDGVLIIRLPKDG